MADPDEKIRERLHAALWERCLDLTRAVNNPFKKASGSTCVYHFVVWIASLGPPSAAYVSQVDGELETRLYP